MATGFTAGTPLGSQYQYTPITFAPLLSLVPQRPAPAAPAPTGMEATAQMPLPTMYGSDIGTDIQGPQYSGPMYGEKSRGEILGEIGKGASFMSSPLTTLASLVMTGKTPSELMAQMFSQQQTQQQPAVVQTYSPEAISLAQQLGVSVNTAQGLVDLGYGSARSTSEESTVGMDAFGPGGTQGGGSSDVSGNIGLGGSEAGGLGDIGYGGGFGGMDTGSYGGDYGGMAAGVDGF